MAWECAFYPNLQPFPGERQLFPGLSRWAPCPARPRLFPVGRLHTPTPYLPLAGSTGLVFFLFKIVCFEFPNGRI